MRSSPLIHEYNDESTYEDSHALLSKRRRRSYRWLFPLIVGFLLGVSLSVLGSTYVRHPTIIEWIDIGSKQFTPEIPIKEIVFVEDGDRNKDVWKTISPIGNGFVNISNPERYGLQPGIPGESGVEIYSVSMFHQIHCLNMIRNKYQILLGGVPEGHYGGSHSHHDEYHTQHCFDFLSQSILCAGDLTLEWARIESDGSRFQVDGWGIPHQCKDPESILAWVEANHGPVNSAPFHNHT